MPQYTDTFNKSHTLQTFKKTKKMSKKQDYKTLVLAHDFIAWIIFLKNYLKEKTNEFKKKLDKSKQKSTIL